tara:strand:+ start:328 stop:1419 length:1092 start_codon:yes stop_codon:yes gene_type:complete
VAFNQPELFAAFAPAALTSEVEQDEHTKAVAEAFDYSFDGVSTFTPPAFTLPDNDFSIGLIVGPSGSGKSTLLANIGSAQRVSWQRQKAIVSQFGSSVDAQERLAAVGLNSVPSWFKPFHVLSTGEKFRADLARRLGDFAVVDEFTSVVDRTVAKSCSNAVQRYIHKKGLKGVVFSSCHYDIVPWLQPCWVFDTATGGFLPRGSLQRPKIKITLEPCGVSAWSMFSRHHYLTEKINKAAWCWVALWGEEVVGFTSSLAFPCGTIKKATRGHRTVILPDFQGLGLGVRISDAMAALMTAKGYRQFSKTTHPRLGEYRNKSPLWRPTSKNMKARKGLGPHQNGGQRWKGRGVFSYSHEYIGPINE